MVTSNLFLFLIIIAIIASLSSSSPSIYDLLRSHGLPAGLLPKGITNFTLDPTTARFDVRLPSACEAKFETQFHFDGNVSGTLRYGEIGQMSGVSAQDLFLWFPVKGVRVDVPSSGLIYFDVGVIRKQFSLSSFETPLDCEVLGLFNGEGIVQNQNGRLENEVDQQSVLRADS